MSRSLRQLSGLALFALLASAVCAAPLKKRAEGDCVVTLPANALSAKGLSTPWIVSGQGCTQNADGMPTFAECVVVDPATGALNTYAPLLINANQKFVKPVVPVLPANAVVGCWFGTNGATTTLKDKTNGKDLAAAKCVNGDPNNKNDIFGQFAACNGAAFFAAANAANVNIPALGTAKNGKPCYTVRSFEIVDMDQSDNVVTTYLLDNNNKIGQLTTANKKTLKNAINNGSDNLLIDAFFGPALGCTPMRVPSLADPAITTGALALFELQAAKLQAAPIALVPPNDPFVVTNAKANLRKQNAYRAQVGQGNAAGTTAESIAYCQNFLDVTAAAIITDAKFTKGFTTPDAGAAPDLFLFLGQRHAASWTGMGCDVLLKNVQYLNAKTKLPIIANMNADGVTTSLTFNTQKLRTLAMQNGLVANNGNNGNNGNANNGGNAGNNGGNAGNNGGNAGGAAGGGAAGGGAGGGAAGTPNYVIKAQVSNCWGNNPANFGMNLPLSVNGVQPMGDANGGLASLKITFNQLKDLTIVQTWNMGTPSTTGNALNFQTLNDQPNPGGIFSSNSVTCTNGAMTPAITSATLTGQLLAGGAINPTITVTKI